MHCLRAPVTRNRGWRRRLLLVFRVRCALGVRTILSRRRKRTRSSESPLQAIGGGRRRSVSQSQCVVVGGDKPQRLGDWIPTVLPAPVLPVPVNCRVAASTKFGPTDLESGPLPPGHEEREERGRTGIQAFRRDSILWLNIPCPRFRKLLIYVCTADFFEVILWEPKTITLPVMKRRVWNHAKYVWTHRIE